MIFHLFVQQVAYFPGKNKHSLQDAITSRGRDEATERQKSLAEYSLKNMLS